MERSLIVKRSEVLRKSEALKRSELLKMSVISEDLEMAISSHGQHELESSDTNRILQIIEEAGKDACGVIGIDLWTMHDDGKLHHFGDGVNWVSPIFKRQLMDGTDPQDIEKLQILDRLENVNNPDYYKPVISTVGVGLAGNFWQHFSASTRSTRYFREYLVWRTVESYTQDPDQMDVPRMNAIGEVFGKVTGIPFNIDGLHKGIVLYYARANADEHMINTAVNSSFLRQAAHNIGSTFALSHARIRREIFRKSQTSKFFLKVKIAFNMVNLHKKLQDESEERYINEEPLDLDSFGKNCSYCQNICNNLKSLASSASNKIKDVDKKTRNPPGLYPPPAGNLAASFWSFIGCFSILLVLFGFHHLVKYISDDELALILPPFGALMTLQFSLTAAPASQPRNSFYGFIVSILVVIVNKVLLSYLAGLPKWFYASLGTSLAIFTMQKFGFIHPPAGAAALVICLSGKSIETDLISGGVLLIADIIVIILATFFNNLNSNRQYPIYWKMNPFVRTQKKIELDGSVSVSSARKKLMSLRKRSSSPLSPKRKQHSNFLSPDRSKV